MASDLRAITFLVLSLAASVSWAEDEDAGWVVPTNSAVKNLYLGAGLARVDNDIAASNQDGSVSNVSTDDEDTSTSLIIGYRINDYLAVEGGYTDTGETDFRGTSDGSGESWVAGSVRTKQEADGWEFGIRGRWPIAPRWYAIGYAGWYWWKNEETYLERNGISNHCD